MDLRHFTYLIFQFVFYCFIPISLCLDKHIEYVRVTRMDDRINHNATFKNNNSIVSCGASCFENQFCVSYIFHRWKLRCVILTEINIPFQHESGWVFFGVLRDLAYKRNAYQSSTITHLGVHCSSDKAVDGNTNTDFYKFSCTHTRVESKPYWYVDLSGNYNIKHVDILNRGDCCGDRLHDVEVTVAEDDLDFNRLCGTFKGPGTDNQLVVMECPQNTHGRYVKLQIVKGNNNILSLCDVKVIGV